MSERTYVDGLKKALDEVKSWRRATESGGKTDKYAVACLNTCDNIADMLKLYIKLEEERHATNKPE